jgi:cytochrome b6-f complex iron-sulfur subunit
MGIALASLGTAGGLWTAAAVRFLLPNTSVAPTGRFRAGRPGDYPVGHVETRYTESHGVWVVHGQYDGRRQIYALSAACTHLGCITLWLDAEQCFRCPCHGSRFTPDGINHEGPAPRPLERYAIRLLDDGRLEIDKSRVFREELGQWTDPDAYVPT